MIFFSVVRTDVLVPGQEDWGYIHGSTVRITKTLILSQWKGIDVTSTIRCKFDVVSSNM